MKIGGFGVRRLARRVAEDVDNQFARGLKLMRINSEQRHVVVAGIYRDSQPIDSAVNNLRASHHRVDVRLGAMGETQPELSQVTTATEMRAGKFQNLNALTEGMGEPDWLVLIDDDVVLPPHFLDRAIELCERFDYALAQPAQTRQSNANWRITKRRLLTIARDSEFVEIGPVTLIRRDAQKLLLPFPADLRYGWGLDFHWAHIIEDAGLKAGILDSLAVVHASRKVASTYSWDAAQEEGRAYLAGVPHLPSTIAAGNGTARHRLIRRSPRRVRQQGER